MVKHHWTAVNGGGSWDPVSEKGGLSAMNVGVGDVSNINILLFCKIIQFCVTK